MHLPHVKPWEGDEVLPFSTFKSFSRESQQRLWMQPCHWKGALHLSFCFKKTPWNAISTLEIARLNTRTFCNEKQFGGSDTEAKLVSQDYSNKEAKTTPARAQGSHNWVWTCEPSCCVLGSSFDPKPTVKKHFCLI